MGLNRKIIKEQNEAAKSGKYITKAEAMRRFAKRDEEAKMLKLRGK